MDGRSGEAHNTKWGFGEIFAVLLCLFAIGYFAWHFMGKPSPF